MTERSTREAAVTSASEKAEMPTLMLTDQHRPLTVYTFHCARCEKPLEGEFGPVWYSGENKIEDYDDLDEAGWSEIDGKWVCLDCWHWCEKVDDGSDKGLGPQEGCCDGL